MSKSEPEKMGEQTLKNFKNSELQNNWGKNSLKILNSENI